MICRGVDPQLEMLALLPNRISERQVAEIPYKATFGTLSRYLEPHLCDVSKRNANFSSNLDIARVSFTSSALLRGHYRVPYPHKLSLFEAGKCPVSCQLRSSLSEPSNASTGNRCSQFPNFCPQKFWTQRCGPRAQELGKCGEDAAYQHR